MAANRAISEELVTLQAAAAATGNGTVLDVTGCSAVVVQTTGTFVGTVTFELSLDGTNYVAVEGTALVDRSVASTMTSTGIVVFPVVAVASFRARVSAYTSGNITVKARALPPGTAEGVIADATFAGTVTLGNVKIQDGDGTNVADVATAAPGASDNGVVVRQVGVPAAAALADATATPTTVKVATFPHAYNGATWDMARGDVTNGLDVDVTRTPKGATATLANVNDQATTTTLQALNTARLAWSCFNDSAADLYVKFGATASATSFTVKVFAGQHYEMPQPVYTGIIDGIWTADSTGAARVTELTA